MSTSTRGMRRAGAWVALAVGLSVIAGLLYAGNAFYRGPFRGLGGLALEWKYRDRPLGETVFYGASNFRLWYSMAEDLKPYALQNHGFGGATDVDLLEQAARLLYPYQPRVVVLQTGSNDLAAGKSLEQVLVDKQQMLGAFRSALPRTRFVVMASLPLPGRARYWPDSQRTNSFLHRYALESHGAVRFVDATAAMLSPAGGFREDLFVADGIHLNDKGRAVWRGFILAALEAAGAPTRGEDRIDVRPRN